MGLICSKCSKAKNKRYKKEQEIIQGSSSIEMNKHLPNEIEGTNSCAQDIYFDKEDMIHIDRLLNEEKSKVHKQRQINNYKKGNLIGEGSYGRVYQGFDEDVGQIIAIKEIDIGRMKNSKNLESKIWSFESEINILKDLNHKNIVKYYGTKRTPENFHILLEYCIGGSIAKMLEVYRVFTENVIRKYTRQILEGLEYLHAHNIIHRDIKGANILVDRDGLCKLSDFGGSKVIRSEFEFSQQNSFKGTPNWMAPETVKSMEYTRFSDIWSIGCTVIEMATGEPPWKEYKNPIQALYNLMHTNSPPEFPSGLSDDCCHFLSCCLKINPRERLNVTKLLRHPFIVGESPYQFLSSSSNKADGKLLEDGKSNFNSGANTTEYDSPNMERKNQTVITSRDIAFVSEDNFASDTNVNNQQDNVLPKDNLINLRLPKKRFRK